MFIVIATRSCITPISELLLCISSVSKTELLLRTLYSMDASRIKKRTARACFRCRKRKVKCNTIKSGSSCRNCLAAGTECHQDHSGPLTNLGATPKFLPIPLASKSNHPYAIPSIIPTEINPVRLPPYISPSQHRLKPHEVEYLTQAGAFVIPQDELRDELLRSFVLYVWPFIPVLDLGDFLEAIDKESGPGISLLLFQVVMFSATTFVDFQWLERAGFPDRITAREYFYDKVKALYDLDWELDRLVLIQTILLHQHWYVTEDFYKDPGHWLGICITFAKSIGIHKPSTYTNKPPKTCRLWRRLWWVCIFRDRVIGLCQRKEMKIEDPNELPILQLNDFDIDTITTNITTLQNLSLLTEGTPKIMLADMFISQLELFLIIGHVLLRLYVLQPHSPSTLDWSMLYSPKTTDVEVGILLDLENEFLSWKRSLNPYCLTDYDDGDIDETTHISLKLHRAALEIGFLMGQELAYRPQDCLVPSTDSRDKVKQIASDVAKLVDTMERQNMVPFLPPMTIPCLIAAIASFLAEIKWEGKSQCKRTGIQFHRTMRCLIKMGDIWPITDGAHSLIGQMITSRHTGAARTLRMLSKPVESYERSKEDDHELAVEFSESFLNSNLEETPVSFANADYDLGAEEFDLAWIYPIQWDFASYGFFQPS
jgi:hypothetical protein